jgi:hypothetical protein
MVLCVCSVLCKKPPLQRADHSFREFVPCVCFGGGGGFETAKMRQLTFYLGCCARNKYKFGLKFKKETSEMLHWKHSFVRC